MSPVPAAPIVSVVLARPYTNFDEIAALGLDEVDELERLSRAVERLAVGERDATEMRTPGRRAPFFAGTLYRLTPDIAVDSPGNRALCEGH